LLTEAQLAYKLRVSQEETEEARKLNEELEPARAEFRELEQKIMQLEDARAAHLHTARDHIVSKHDVTELFRAQTPDLSQLRSFVSYQ